MAVAIVDTFVPDLIYVVEHPTLFGSALTPPLMYGENLFRGSKAKIPDGTGPYMSIIETLGRSDEGTHNSVDVPAYVRPAAQLVFRASDAVDARSLADQVYFLLWPLQNLKINGTWWRELSVRSRPFELGVDAKNLIRFVFNIDSVKRLSPVYS